MNDEQGEDTGPAAGRGEEPRSLLKKVLIGIAVVWALAAAALLIVPRLPGTVDYRALLIEQIEARTGRQAFIDGDVTMRLLPTPEIAAEDVRIANIDGAPSSDVIRVPHAVFRLERAPLVARKIRITEVVLTRPKIYLDVLPDGRKSWDFRPVKKPGKVRKVGIDGFKAKDASILYRKGEAQTMLTGDLSWDGGGERPVFEARLQGGKLDLDQFLEPRDSGPGQARAGGKRWSDGAIDLSALRHADGRLKLSADELRYRRYLLDKPSLAATLENGQLRIEKAAAGLFGGAATAKGILDARETPAVTLDVTLEKGSVDKALSDWADTPFASGTFRMTANLSAKGATQRAMVESLAGTALIEAKEGVVRGFDSARLNEDMSRLSRYSDFLDLADSALSGGQSRYTRIGGGIAFKDGVGELKDVKAAFDGAAATARGSVDLPRWNVDLALSMKLAGKELAKAPPVALTLAGPLDSPDQKTHLGAVGKYVGKKFVRTVIDDVLGDDEPHADDTPRAERRERTKRTVNKLLDKLERRRDRVKRHEPEPEPYYDEPYDYAYPEDGYPPEDEYSPPSYRLEPGPSSRPRDSGSDGYRGDEGYPQDYPDEEYDYPPDDRRGSYRQGYRPGPGYGPYPGYPDDGY
ncbi:MAG: AsmA family protein [Sphingomonadales bacterium]